MSGFNSIDGIISGLDTTSIIDAIIEYDRVPAYLMENEQTEKTNIVTTLKALQAKIYAVQAQVQQLTKASTFEKSSVQLSQDGYLTATATGRVGVGSYDLQVLSVAHNHQIASQGFSEDEINAFGTGTIEIGVGSASPQTITIDASNNTLTEIKDAINEAKVGVTASIVNDGSEENSYRLMITADSTGLSNTISFTSNLTGGPNLNFSTSSFDVPETLYAGSGTSSAASLSASATYTGDTNKTYTFTVAGESAQTVGTDNITINWTDGTNSGSILVTQADTDFELVGDGADGLSLTFSAGDLTAGDTFQVQTFAPLLQEASNAVISLGSTGGTGSPITVVSGTNTFDDVVPGVNIDVTNETPVGEYVTVSTDMNIAGIKESIQDFLDAYNDVNEYIDEQNSYDQDSEEGGILLGDSITQSIQYQIRNIMSSMINGANENYQHLSSIGIRTSSDGSLVIKDSTRLEEALRDNLDDVIALFTDSGYSSTTGIEFVSAGVDTREGDDYIVDITQAATQGTWTGVEISDPSTSAIVLDSSNNRLKITVNGRSSEELVLTEKSYDSVEELINELQLKIDSDTSVGSLGVNVEWVEDGTGSGHIVLTSSMYGSNSKIAVDTSVSNGAANSLGLSAGIQVDGLDVKGTINGEEATGSGQYLTGSGDNDTTAGLKLRITLTAEQVGSGSEGTITFAKGLASKLNTRLTSLNDSNSGLLTSRISSYEKQIDNLTERIDEFDERLELKRERLTQQYQDMETALAELASIGDSLESSIAGLNANWKWNNSGS